MYMPSDQFLILHNRELFANLIDKTKFEVHVVGTCSRRLISVWKAAIFDEISWLMSGGDGGAGATTDAPSDADSSSGPFPPRNRAKRFSRASIRCSIWRYSLMSSDLKKRIWIKLKAFYFFIKWTRETISSVRGRLCSYILILKSVSGFNNKNINSQITRGSRTKLKRKREVCISSVSSRRS